MNIYNVIEIGIKKSRYRFSYWIIYKYIELKRGDDSFFLGSKCSEKKGYNL